MPAKGSRACGLVPALSMTGPGVTHSPRWGPGGRQLWEAVCQHPSRAQCGGGVRADTSLCAGSLAGWRRLARFMLAARPALSSLLGPRYHFAGPSYPARAGPQRLPACAPWALSQLLRGRKDQQSEARLLFVLVFFC